MLRRKEQVIEEIKTFEEDEGVSFSHSESVAAQDKREYYRELTSMNKISNLRKEVINGCKEYRRANV